MEWLPAQTFATPSPGVRDAPAGTRAVASGVAAIRRHPDATSEQVTEALLHTPAVPLAEEHGWVHVRLPDYEGWIESAHLAAPAPATESVAVILAPRTLLSIDAEGQDILGPAYATTILPVLKDEEGTGRVHVGLPGGRFAWVARADVATREASRPFPPAGTEAAIALAWQLLGTPYLWGGVTMEGIDCSGLAQLCCRAAGRIVLRDADQQYDSIPYVVERGSLRGGDLIFFARGGAVTHVALMTDEHTYVHAKGSPESRVMVNSLDPADEAYNPWLADLYAGARRPFA